ncbi:MAG: preprotein translocase subunit SecA [Chloroflexi bacterium]|nr:preprotein translocase subunit SecA [Chloroflexota bacterium]MBV9893972.1 preprotein translocase subunit SecA [Chloroflexota bacterium]
MLNWITKLGGDPSEREIKKLRPYLAQINALESDYKALSDDALKDKTTEFRGRFLAGESLDDLLPEAFAAVREAAARTIGKRHYDVQMLAGAVLHSGRIAEMRTGEGKTLVATLPLYLNALEEKGAHLVTPNDYLSRLGGGWMGPVYAALGLKVGVIAHEFSAIYDPEYQDPQKHPDERLNHWRPVEQRSEAYEADITYGTNNEFGFDYLRDNMVWEPDRKAQRPLHYAIVDEVDNILIDEARTPLIISGPAEEANKLYSVFSAVAKNLVGMAKGEDDDEPDPDADVLIDEKYRSVTPTDRGIDKVESMLQRMNPQFSGSIYDPQNAPLTHYLDNALKAQFLFHLDDQYIVNPEGEIVIVDEFTGRLMPGRRYSEGLHQAIEAKEGVQVQRENVTLARITFQNYFRMYGKLAGMTGTAWTEREEFQKIYDLDVVVIPTHKPMIRADQADLVYKTEDAKFSAVIDEIAEFAEIGRPVLVGTTSVEKSERLHEMLSRRGVPHEVLNAKQHEREAWVIAQAGRPGAVTIATNMAGRGVDILLGGNPDGLVEEILRKQDVTLQEATDEQRQAAWEQANRQCERDADRVRLLGGLHVLGTERHEARRIDHQLRGRAGRQGDPGSSRFFVSLEDELMRRFGGASIANLMDKLGLEEDVPLEHSWVSRAIENAQEKVEAFYFDQRKHVVEFDDVLNRQRDVVYGDRDRVLFEENLKPLIMEWVEERLVELTDEALGGDRREWDVETLRQQVERIFPMPENFDWDEIERLTDREEVVDHLMELSEAAYDHKEQELGHEQMRLLERIWMLNVMDRLWIQHLTAIDDLREGIGLRAYGQKDPLIEYKVEAARMFDDLQANIRADVVNAIYHLQMRQQAPPPPPPTEGAFENSDREGGSGDSNGTAKPQRRIATNAVGARVAPAKIGRNQKCPCGSGKKYKFCHGANTAR